MLRLVIVSTLVGMALAPIPAESAENKVKCIEWSHPNLAEDMCLYNKWEESADGRRQWYSIIKIGNRLIDKNLIFSTPRNYGLTTHIQSNSTAAIKVNKNGYIFAFADPVLDLRLWGYYVEYDGNNWVIRDHRYWHISDACGRDIHRRMHREGADPRGRIKLEFWSGRPPCLAEIYWNNEKLTHTVWSLTRECEATGTTVDSLIIDIPDHISGEDAQKQFVVQQQEFRCKFPNASVDNIAEIKNNSLVVVTEKGEESAACLFLHRGYSLDQCR